MLLEVLRKELVFYGNQMIKNRLTINTGGNLSARDPATGYIVIKPTSRHYELLRPEDIPVIDADGKKVDGDYEPSSEWPMHTLIYRKMPRVMSIVHSHSIYATACSVAGEPIPLLHHEISVYCSGPVRIAPFTIPGSVDLGRSALDHLADNNVVLLQNHGPLAIGASLWHAFDAICAVEQAAATFFITKQMGTCTPIPPEGLKRLRSFDPLLQPGVKGIAKAKSV